MLIEGASFEQALFMTVITISTVGYEESVPLSPNGRLFTIALIVLGVGAGLYFVSVLAESLLEGRLRDIYRRGSMLRQIERLRDHVIVCGYGRFGRIVVQDLRRSRKQVVVVESDAALEPELAREGLLYVVGSATDDEVLEAAGIRRASAVVVALSSESDSVFVTLAAHELNRELVINARSESDAAVRRLRRAGATHVVSPLTIGGTRAAMSVMRPTVLDFLELSSSGKEEEIDLEEILVEPGAAIDGALIREIEEGADRLRVVALKSGPEGMRIVPPRDARVSADDHLVVIGTRADLERTALRAQAPAS